MDRETITTIKCWQQKVPISSGRSVYHALHVQVFLTESIPRWMLVCSPSSSSQSPLGHQPDACDRLPHPPCLRRTSLSALNVAEEDRFYFSERRCGSLSAGKISKRRSPAWAGLFYMLIWLSSCSHDCGSEHELGEVALSPPPTALQNELEQLFQGLKPDGAAVQFNRKCRILFCTCKQTLRSFKNLDISQVFTLNYDFSVGSICIAQDWNDLSPTYAEASKTPGPESDPIRPLIDRWSYCLDLCVHELGRQAVAKRLLPVRCAAEARNFSPRDRTPGVRPEHCVLFPHYSVQRYVQTSFIWSQVEI